MAGRCGAGQVRTGAAYPPRAARPTATVALLADTRVPPNRPCRAREGHTGTVDAPWTTWLRQPDGWHPAKGDPRPGQHVWLHLTGKPQLEAAAAAFGLDLTEVRQIRAQSPRGRHVRPHVEELSDGVQLTAPTLAYLDETSDVLTGEVACLVLGTTVVTWETGVAGVLDTVAEHLATRQPGDDHLTAGVLSTLLTVLVDAAADVEDALAQDVQELEDLVFSSLGGSPVEEIYRLKREIAETRRALLPLGTELTELVADPDRPARGDAWARRLSVATDRLDRRLDAHDTLLADMLSAHLATVSVRQNDDVRRISSWAAIAAAPTLLASIYGMNFRHMPELTWPAGYPIAIGVMVGVSVVLHRLFVRSGWL